jgi:hypothetical protein
MGQGVKEERLARAARLAGDYEAEAISCAQGTIAALHEVFSLPGDRALLIKAATYLPGLVSRGEACGAMVAGIIALGLEFGKSELSHESYETAEGKAEARRRKILAWQFCEEFKKEWGSTSCSAIRPQIMGRDYDMWDQREWDQFLADGGTEKCRKPAELAARIAGRIILEERQRSDTTGTR